VAEYKVRLPDMLSTYDDNGIFNCDETGLFFKTLQDKTLCMKSEDCKWGKLAKERYTVRLCCSFWAGKSSSRY
jgi:hypothetical protein